MATQTGQKNNEHLSFVRKDFPEELCSKFKLKSQYEAVLLLNFINMDERAVFLKERRNQRCMLLARKQFQ